MGCNNSKQVEITTTKETRTGTGQHGGGYKPKEPQTTGFSSASKEAVKGDMSAGKTTIKGDLYVAWPSAPCRAVLMTCAALGVRPNFKTIDLFKGEHKSPEYVAVNPFHTVPMYVDGDFKLLESRAIMSYFVTTFGSQDHPLYPSDLQKRAMIDNVLNADQNNFYKTITGWALPQLVNGKKVADLQQEADALKKALKTLDEYYLTQNTYVAGSQLTIADFSVVAGITFLEAMDFDLSPFPKISEWLGRMKKLPYFQKCNEAIYKLKDTIKPSAKEFKKIEGDLYVAWPSAPCRAVLMTCAELGVRPNFKALDIFKGEHKSAEFMAINPLHTLPTFVDGDFKLWESRAIMCYFVSTFAGQDHPLYPSDPTKRAMVDNVLHADQGTFYKAILEWVVPQFPNSTKKVNLDVKAEGVKKALTTLDEYYLTKNEFVAGSHLTIADFSVVAGVTFLDLFDYDISKFPKITAWMNRMKKLPYFEKCNQGLYEAKAKLQQKKD